MYIAKAYDDKYYRAVLQKIFALGKDGISIYDLLEFKGITRSFSHFEKQTDRISQVNKLGYPIAFMPKLFERDIHNPNDIKKLVDIREEGLIRKDKLSYSFWQAEADDVEELLLSEPKYTLNTLNFLGKKSFLASFEEKYNFVGNIIDNLGRIDEEFPLYEELLRLTNPTESKLYLENREKITTLKKLYQKNQEDNELKASRDFQVLNHDLYVSMKNSESLEKKKTPKSVFVALGVGALALCYPLIRKDFKH